MEILSSLGIDPAVMLAQAVNFFALLAILTFLVYKPVLKLLDERKERIAKAEEHAQLVEDKLARAEELTQKELKKAQQKASEIITAAKESATAQGEEMIETAKAKVGKIVEEGRAVITKERDDAARQIQEEVGKIVILATEKLLKRSIDDKDQAKFVEDAITEISTIK
ncbi:MAG: F0F1 ATP synthase subunit B [Candidatus Peribacteraceae bacterium]|nr:F0F1 ATP synthase subunit B [Candidatus Peribacteraceae bacterium]